MKLNKVLLGLSLAISPFYGLMAEPAPVIDISNDSSGNLITEASSVTLSVSEKLANLERKLDSRNRAQVNVQRQLDEIQNEVNELRGVTELHSHQLSQVIERQRDLYQELERRVTQALASSKEPIVATPNNSDVEAVVNYSSDLTENEAYDHAVNMVLKEKRYDQAIPEFKAFVAKYPKSNYVSNSHYWIGQLLFQKGNIDEAKDEFNKVVKNHLNSDKRPDAILKLALLEEKQKNLSQAQILYKKVIDEYPDSTAAKSATSKLQRLQPQ